MVEPGIGSAHLEVKLRVIVGFPLGLGGSALPRVVESRLNSYLTHKDVLGGEVEQGQVGPQRGEHRVQRHVEMLVCYGRC